MDFVSLLITASALSMDAFAASVCQGLASSGISPVRALISALAFAFFQTIMPLIGYAFAGVVSASLASFGHVIAFVLLCIIGINMLSEADKKATEETDAFSFGTTLFMAFASGIDALAVGITFSLTRTPGILSASLITGLTAFLFSLSGIFIGSVFGARFKRGAQIVAGFMLILIGAKILLQSR